MIFAISRITKLVENDIEQHVDDDCVDENARSSDFITQNEFAHVECDFVVRAQIGILSKFFIS